MRLSARIGIAMAVAAAFGLTAACSSSPNAKSAPVPPASSRASLSAAPAPVPHPLITDDKTVRDAGFQPVAGTELLLTDPSDAQITETVEFYLGNPGERATFTDQLRKACPASANDAIVPFTIKVTVPAGGKPGNTGFQIALRSSDPAFNQPGLLKVDYLTDTPACIPVTADPNVQSGAPSGIVNGGPKETTTIHGFIVVAGVNQPGTLNPALAKLTIWMAGTLPVDPTFYLPTGAVQSVNTPYGTISDPDHSGHSLVYMPLNGHSNPCMASAASEGCQINGQVS